MTAFPPKTPKPVTAEPSPLTDPTTSNLDPGASEGFSRDLERARKALGGLLQRLRRIRHETPAVATLEGASSAELVARLQLGLKKEHDLVLVPLLGRLEAFATVLNKGGDVPAPAIEQGLALVDRYLHELHDEHLRLLQVSGVDPAKGEAARLAFMQLASDYEHGRVRWATVRVMFRGYEDKTPAGRAMFGLTLAQECRAELAWHDFEEVYVQTSIPPRFPARVAETWATELDKSRTEGRADRTRVDAWVAETNAFVPSKA